MKLKKYISLLLTLTLLLCMPVQAMAMNVGDSTGYQWVDWHLSSASFSWIEPGTYQISSSNLPDAANDILDGISWFCVIPGADFLLGGACRYVAIGNKFVRFTKNARYTVTLTDAATGAFVWSGTLGDADDLCLGSDHTAYNVTLTPQNGSFRVALIRK